MSGFPSGTTAQCEGFASSIPVSFSVAWEGRDWPRGLLALFFRAALSRNIFTFILTNSVQAAELGKGFRSVSYLNTQLRLPSVSTEQGGQVPVLYFEIKLKVIN